jgi:hypothetical protein
VALVLFDAMTSTSRSRARWSGDSVADLREKAMRFGITDAELDAGPPAGQLVWSGGVRRAPKCTSRFSHQTLIINRDATECVARLDRDGSASEYLKRSSSQQLEQNAREGKWNAKYGGQLAEPRGSRPGKEMGGRRCPGGSGGGRNESRTITCRGARADKQSPRPPSSRRHGRRSGLALSMR